MYPMFGWTDSYPHSRNQMGAAPHMKMDSARPLAMFEPWPYGSSYGCSYPTECHGCCNHHYSPSHYSLKPSFPHFPVLSPHHCHGSYPVFPGNYPVIPVHQIPPPHYYVEQPRYEYDKCYPAAHHCCGCACHSFRREPDKNVNIEEQEPVTVKKSSEPVVPSQLNNYPNPIVMIPPGHFKNSEGVKSTESASKEENGCENDSRCDMISKSHDVNPQGSLSSEKECQSQQDSQNQFPFSLLWLPYGPDDVGKEDLKGTNHGQQEVKDGNDGKMKISSSVNGSNMENDAFQTIAPSKKMEKVEDKKKDLERKAKSIPVKQADDSSLKEHVDCIAKKQPSSPKSSKLPPVCLRVDPVLKTKKGKGDSRSPSPVDKRRLKQSLNEDPESLREDVQSHNQAGRSKEVDQTKSMDAEEKSVIQTKDHVPLFESSHEVIPLGKSANECVDGASSKDVGDRMGNEVILEGQSGNDDDGKKLKRKLSDSEAAAIIQSAYHGYEVRKLETLKKLRQINEISEKVAEVKTCVCAMEACYDIQSEEKQLVAIGETIMSLLLKLDTIQGLHPSIRDVRKSAAKELVSLQEKLDSLIARKSEVSAVVSSPEPLVDHHTENIIDCACVPGCLNGVEPVFDNEALGSGEDIKLESETKSQDNDMIKKNSVSILEPLQRPELPSQIPGPISLMDSENKFSEGPLVGGEKSQKVGSELQRERENQKHEAFGGHLQMREVLADQECLRVDHSSENPGVLAIDKTNSAGDSGSSSKKKSIGNNDEAIDLEPSQGALEQMIDDQVYEKTDEAKREDSIVVEADSASPNENTKPNVLEHADENKQNDENDMEEAQLEPEKMQGEAEEKELSHTKKQVIRQEVQCRTNLDENLMHEVNFGSSTNEELPIHDKMVDLLVNSVEATGEVVVEDDLLINSVETSEENVVDESVGQTEKSIFLSQATSETPKEDIVGGVEFGAKNVRTALDSSVDSQVFTRNDTQLMEENARLKEMMEKLIEAGNKQLATISKLSGKVQDLEKKLSRNKKPKARRFRGKHQDVVLV